MKFRGENHHEITVVAPTGFEPVFSVHHGLISCFTSRSWHMLTQQRATGDSNFEGGFEAGPAPRRYVGT